MPMMRPLSAHVPNALEIADPVLSDDALAALKAACTPVGLRGYPSTDILRVLRLNGYVVFVLGGLQITPAGLERLLRERIRMRSLHLAKPADP